MPETVKINDGQYYAVLGFITLLLQKRKQLDDLEKLCADFIEQSGGKQTDSPYNSILSGVQEAIYNEGDDPESATEGLLTWVGLERESA